MPATRKSRPLIAILGFVLLVLFLGALLSPLLFFGVQALIRTSPDSWLAQGLADKEFPSFFNRACLIALVIGLFPLLKSLKMKWGEITGSVRLSSGWKDLVTGFGLAVLLLAGMAALFIWAGVTKLKPDADGWAVGMPLLSGFTVAIMEEFIFRGAVLSVLCRSLGLKAGLWWTTLIFAAVHFLKPPADGVFPDESITWLSGFAVIPYLFQGFGRWENFIGEFLMLAAVGWALGKARLTTNGLWASIGLHAGWVAGMKYFSSLTLKTKAFGRGDFDPWMVENTCRAIVSPVVGIVPILFVLLTGVLTLWVCRRSRSPKDQPLS
ncbi:MAG: hypothetical protein RL693_75 [Verrucomicrobiota bacterium]|jgi:membrane protease YdiL (CAAX protease family)